MKTQVSHFCLFFVSLFVSLCRVDLPVALTELKLLNIQGWSLLSELCLLLPMPVVEVKACPSMWSYIFFLSFECSNRLP